MLPYINVIRRADVLTPEEEKRLARRYRDTGDRDAREQLIVSNLRFVIRTAHQFGGYGVSLDDRIQGIRQGGCHSFSVTPPARGRRPHTDIRRLA